MKKLILPENSIFDDIDDIEDIEEPGKKKTVKKFEDYGIKMDSKSRQALEDFRRPAFYGTVLQCPK